MLNPPPELCPFLRTSCAAILLTLPACGPEKQSSSDASTTDTGEPTTATPTSTGTGQTPPTTATPTSTGDTSLDTSLDTTIGAGTEAATTSSNTTGADLTCPDHEHTDACCCFEENRDDPFLGLDGTRSVCGTPTLCPPIELDCGDYPPCPDDQLTTTDAADLDCVLKALAQGDAGRVEWQINFSLGVEVVQYDLVGDTTLFRQHVIDCDLSPWTDPVVQLSLPPADYFTDCLAEPEPLARFICLRDAPFPPPLATCLDGEDYGGVIC